MRDDGLVTVPPPVFLESAAAEIEAHVGLSGWDRRPTLFALVRAAQFALDEPDAAARLGLDAAVGDALTPIEQDELPDGSLDEALARVAWPASVAGCALSQEIVLLPPSAEAELSGDTATLGAAAAHPDRREARLVVAVLRDGASAVVLRLRGTGGSDDDLLTGPDLAPNLVGALLATLS
ncbi:MAG: hypothetical protein JWO57_646 [Pseudonocardiales bacterium]|nr:hypothetical protein [Pseudonocardiales bacterium]